MSDQDYYGGYTSQQAQHKNANMHSNSYTSFDNQQAHFDSAGQQQMMYDEYAEQSQHGEGIYRGYDEHGEHEYYAGSGEKLRQVTRPRRSKGFWSLLVLALLLVMMVGTVFGYRDGHTMPYDHGMMGGMQGGMQKHDHMMGGMGFSGDGNTNTQQVTLPSGMTPTLTINNTNGSVIVNSANGTSNVATITVSSQSGDNTKNVAVNLDKQHDVLSIDTSNFSDGSDITVTIPSNVNVQVQNGSGDVNVSGIGGQVNLESQDGSISLSQDNLSGQSSIKTQNGSINFNGSLSQQGSYDFESVTGSINLQLPSNASFQLVNSSGNINNEFNNNEAGSSPRPLLSVSSQGGDTVISPEQ